MATSAMAMVALGTLLETGLAFSSRTSFVPVHRPLHHATTARTTARSSGAVQTPRACGKRSRTRLLPAWMCNANFNPSPHCSCPLGDGNPVNPTGGGFGGGGGASANSSGRARRGRACSSLQATSDVGSVSPGDDDRLDPLEDGGEETEEVEEEELREDWAARGLDPEAFDPLALLRMWASEDDEDEMDKESIDAVMTSAAAEKSRERWKKKRQGFRDMDGDDDVDVDALMAAAAAQSKAGRGAEEGLEEREMYDMYDEDAEDSEMSRIAEMLEMSGGASDASQLAGMLELLDESGTQAASAEQRKGGPGGARLPGRAVGIDLGTTNSAVGVIVDGEPTLVPNARGKFTTPSVVSFKAAKTTKKRSSRSSRPSRSSASSTPPLPPPSASSSSSSDESRGTANGDGEAGRRSRPRQDKAKGARVVVGEKAVARIATHPRSTYSSVKRVVGRTRKEAKEAGVGLGALNVDQSQPYLRLKCPAIGDGVTIPPEELSAEILRVLIRDAERFIGDGARVKRAVVAVPAYFNPTQCAATERAGRLAGLEKVKLMREPEAAALAYGLDKGGDEIILVFDLGGGTFDVSVLEVGGGIAEVIATSGDSKLGGDDFDQAITEWLFEEISNAGGGDARSSPVATRQLIEAARSARERLSDSAETEVELTFADGGVGSTTLTRSKMEALIAEPLKRIMAPVREAAIMADVSLPGDTGAFMDYDADESRASRQGDEESLRRLRSEQSKARKRARTQSKNLKKQVSSMAEVARSMDGNAKLRRFPQGRMVDQVVLVGGATRMPCVQKLVAGITGVKPRRTVDPDKAVALGAAAYAGILEGEVEGQEVMTAWQASVYRMMARDGYMQ